MMQDGKNCCTHMQSRVGRVIHQPFCVSVCVCVCYCFLTYTYSGAGSGGRAICDLLAPAYLCTVSRAAMSCTAVTCMFVYICVIVCVCMCVCVCVCVCLCVCANVHSHCRRGARNQAAYVHVFCICMCVCVCVCVCVQMCIHTAGGEHIIRLPTCVCSVFVCVCVCVCVEMCIHTAGGEHVIRLPTCVFSVLREAMHTTGVAGSSKLLCMSVCLCIAMRSDARSEDIHTQCVFSHT